MSKKFLPLDYSRGWDDYWRDHPQGYSPQEQMINWSGQLNAMIDFFNEYFDVDLTEYATDVMEGWYFDGRLDEIINEALFNSKADKTTVNSLIDRLDTHASQLAETMRFANVRTFGAVGDKITDDTNAFIQASNYATENNIPLLIPYGNYLVSGLIEISTDVISQGTIWVENGSNGQIKIVRKLTPVTVDTSSISGLTKGSTKITGLTGYSGTLVLESTETAIERTNGDTYIKAESCTIDKDGNISPPLFNSYGTLSATIHPDENPLKIEIDVRVMGDVYTEQDHVIGVYRSDVEFVKLDLINESTISQPYQGVRVQNSVNVIFNRTKIKGFKRSGNGYGIAQYNVSYLTINNGLIGDCRHCISGRNTKETYINGGVYISFIGTPLDTHWGDGFYIKEIISIASDGVSHIATAGANVKVRGCTLNGGRNIVGIRNDSPELDGIVDVQDTSWNTMASNAWVVGFDSPSLEYTFSRRIKNPTNITLKNISVNGSNVVVGVSALNRKYSQTAWGKIIIENINVNNAVFRFTDMEKNADYYEEKNTLIKVTNVEFTNKTSDCMTLIDNSTTLTNTYGFVIEVDKCKDLQWKASESACLSVLIKNSVVNQFYKQTVGHSFIGEYTIESCELPSTSFNGTMLLNFKNCVFSGEITSSNLTMTGRTISASGNLAKTGTTGIPANIENYKNETYYL